MVKKRNGITPCKQLFQKKKNYKSNFPGTSQMHIHTPQSHDILAASTLSHLFPEIQSSANLVITQKSGTVSIHS